MDYLPAQDQAFEAWLAQFISYANANLIALGIVAGDVTPVATAGAAFSAALINAETARAASEAATQTKATTRADAEAAARALVARLQASPAVNDTERAALGITVRDRNPTPVPPPATSPVAIVSTAQRLKHTLRIADETTPSKRAKPAGVTGCQVWAKIGGAPPASESELAFLGAVSKGTFEQNFVMDQGNEPVYYRLRWVNAKGDVGPWSEVAMATIAA